MDSILDFKVAKRPISVLGAEDRVSNYRALVREDTGKVLSVVSTQYRLLQNSEVFGNIEDRLAEELGETHMRSANTSEQITKNGKICMKQWHFPDISIPSRDRTRGQIQLRVVGTNGFGNHAAKCYWGGIDTFCLNGMILGEQIQWVRMPHYGRYQLDDRLYEMNSIKHSFDAWSKTYLEWQHKKVRPDEVSALLEDSFDSHRLKDLMLEQLDKEYARRGMTLWAVYSALTFYASHTDNQFSHPAPNGEMDEFRRRWNRELTVVKIINSKAWRKLEQS